MEMFKYLVITLDEIDDYWPAVRQNITRASSVCGESGDTAMMRRGGPQGAGNVSQVDGTNDITVWFVYFGPFGGNEEEVRRSTHIFSHTDHGEASVADIRRYMGDARSGSSVKISRNTVGNELYRETTGNRGTVGVVATDI